MSSTPEENPFGAPPGDIWNDVPLFREIQRVLMSSSGPVNWELARQVGIASASLGTEDPAPSDEDRRAFEDAVRVAELQVAGFTGLEAPSDIPKVEAVRRGQWVQANIEGLRALLEPAATKIGDAIAIEIAFFLGHDFAIAAAVVKDPQVRSARAGGVFLHFRDPAVFVARPIGHSALAVLVALFAHDLLFVVIKN